LGNVHQHNINTLVDELGTQIEAVNKGDMSRPEALLIAQAHTLDAFFGRLLDASVKNMGEYLGATESYMRLSLKAQSQCAQTIRALNELKSPKNVAFIQQANLANGHLDFPGFARHQIALKCNSMRGVYERQTVYR
jgi:hypothetical protein